MNNTVLFVDDEQFILKSIRRLFSDRDVRLLTAGCADDALEILRNEQVAVIVSDNMMPGMRGIDLLAEMKTISPDTTKILMTAHADLSVAVDAINRGEVFRFIMKPWNDDILVSTVTEALNRYRLIRSLSSGDELTLRSLAHAIELKDPYTRGHSDRVAEYALMIADTFNLPDDLKRVIKFGSIIHDCGKIGVPENILNKRSSLSIEEYDIIKNHPRWGADVALQANLDPRVVNIILHHHEKYDGSGYPAGLKGDEIPLEVQIVTAADVYDALTSDRCYRKRYSDEKAARIMLEMKNVIFDPQVVDRFIHQCIGCSDEHFTGPGTAMIIP